MICSLEGQPVFALQLGWATGLSCSKQKCQSRDCSLQAGRPCRLRSDHFPFCSDGHATLESCRELRLLVRLLEGGGSLQRVCAAAHRWLHENAGKEGSRLHRFESPCRGMCPFRILYWRVHLSCSASLQESTAARCIAAAEQRLAGLGQAFREEAQLGPFAAGMAEQVGVANRRCRCHVVC